VADPSKSWFINGVTLPVDGGWAGTLYRCAVRDLALFTFGVVMERRQDNRPYVPDRQRQGGTEGRGLLQRNASPTTKAPLADLGFRASVGGGSRLAR
jgi:hypothetical protein